MRNERYLGRRRKAWLCHKVLRLRVVRYQEEQLWNVRTGCHLFHGSFNPKGAAGKVLAPEDQLRLKARRATSSKTTAINILKHDG